MAGISLPNSIIQIALFERPPKLTPFRISKVNEKIQFFHSQPKSKVGEIVAGILMTDTPLSRTFFKSNIF